MINKLIYTATVASNTVRPIYDQYALIIDVVYWLAEFSLPIVIFRDSVLSTSDGVHVQILLVSFLKDKLFYNSSGFPVNGISLASICILFLNIRVQ